MNVRPPSVSEKFAPAILLWLFASFVSIPLWDLADTLFHAYRDGSLPRAAVDLFLLPGGTLMALALMFGIVAEHGIGSIAERYRPAFPIASAFTLFFLRSWWRRS